jgi:hypothetical protein
MDQWQGGETGGAEAAIRARVSIIEERVIGILELPVQTVSSVTTMAAEVLRLAEPWERFALLIDLTEAGRPDAEVREALERQCGQYTQRAVHAAFVVGGNMVMRAMVFLVGHVRLGFRSVSTHVSREEALEELRRALVQR